MLLGRRNAKRDGAAGSGAVPQPEVSPTLSDHISGVVCVRYICMGYESWALQPRRRDHPTQDLCGAPQVGVPRGVGPDV